MSGLPYSSRRRAWGACYLRTPFRHRTGLDKDEYSFLFSKGRFW